MARKLRFESEGGLYHVINRGNRLSWVFESEGAKRSFEKTLYETCERSGWILHAWVIMGNHFHLAVETPQPNLSEGMRWLQSVFAVRYNHFRKDTGHIFQGRFKSIAVENQQRMGWLSHYIHLNPVRAGICDVAGLRDYEFSSYRQLWNRKARPSFLEVSSCLEAVGGLADSLRGHRKYAEYLTWLAEDESAQKEMSFAKMSKGWAQGGDGFRTKLISIEQELAKNLKLGVSEAKEYRESMWERQVGQALELLELKGGDLSNQRKAADWKVGIAAKLRMECLGQNGWLSQRLDMGAESAVSRYCAELQQGSHPGAGKLFDLISANSKD